MCKLVSVSSFNAQLQAPVRQTSRRLRLDVVLHAAGIDTNPSASKGRNPFPRSRFGLVSQLAVGRYRRVYAITSANLTNRLFSFSDFAAACTIAVTSRISW